MKSVNTSLLLHAFNCPVQQSKNNAWPSNEKGDTENFVLNLISKNWGSTLRDVK